VVDNKLSKEAKHTLDVALKVLEHAMDLAVAKEDLDAMVAISDRLMLLYQHLADKNVRKFKTGFSIMDNTTKKADSEDDESD
jgi:hypothetical protein